MAGNDRSRIVLTALDLAATAAQCRQVHDVRDHLLPAIARATGGHLAIYHQLAMAPYLQEFGVFWPNDPAVATALANYPAVVHHSPLVQYFSSTARPGLVAVSDLMSHREWHENPVYRESHRLLEIEDHVAMLWSVEPGRVHGITVGRHRGCFTADARTTLSLLAPHLDAALQRCLDSGVPYRVLRTIPTPEPVWVTGPAVVLASSAGRLTPREREVLTLVGAGLTSVSIALRLGTAPRTVEKHLENAYRKLGVTCRFEATAAIREGRG